MADKRLNEVTKVTDMAYVPVVMADGSIGQIAKADLASVVAGFIPFLNNSRTISAINGRRLIEIGRVSSWQRGSFIASIGNSYGTESDILSISFCLENQTPRISYKRVGSSTLGFKILYKMVGNILQVYLWSSVTSDSMLCISGLSSHSIEIKGVLDDVSAYNEVVSL